MDITKVAVIGSGTMGNGIAHIFSMKNFKVFLVEMEQSLLDRGMNMINSNMERQIKKGIITVEDKHLFLKNIQPIIGITKLPNDIQLIIEAITEDKDVKLSLFKKLENIIDKKSIFASNTSSISITELGSSCRPDNFIGMHFMNPVPVMELVEVIRGYSTSDDTFNKIKEIALYLNKRPVEVFDYPGFISNRVLLPMINEAIFALYEGVATAEDIDTVMKLGMNHPMGPLTLADFIGLDVCLAIMEVLYKGFNDSKYRPCPLLKKMVAAGKLGRKSGNGFYKY